MTSQTQNQWIKCRYFETNQDIKKLPWQIYSKLPKALFKHFNSKINVIEFYTHPFKDLSCMLFGKGWLWKKLREIFEKSNKFQAKAPE